MQIAAAKKRLKEAKHFDAGKKWSRLVIKNFFFIKIKTGISKKGKTLSTDDILVLNWKCKFLEMQCGSN